MLRDMKKSERMIFYRKMVTEYCHRCKNVEGGRAGKCPKCVYESEANKIPISFEERQS